MSYSEEDRQQITSSFLDSDETDDKDKYNTTDSAEDNMDNIDTTVDVGPGHSIMKVKGKHHENHLTPTTTTPFIKDKNNSSEQCYFSHILIFFSCAFSLRYFRL